MTPSTMNVRQSLISHNVVDGHPYIIDSGEYHIASAAKSVTTSYTNPRYIVSRFLIPAAVDMPAPKR